MERLPEEPLAGVLGIALDTRIVAAAPTGAGARVRVVPTNGRRERTGAAATNAAAMLESGWGRRRDEWGGWGTAGEQAGTKKAVTADGTDWRLCVTRCTGRGGSGRDAVLAVRWL